MQSRGPGCPHGGDPTDTAGPSTMRAKDRTWKAMLMKTGGPSCSARENQRDAERDGEHGDAEAEA